MESDRPSQEGRKDVPSESSFLVSAPAADPTLVSDAFQRDDSPGTDLSMVTRSRARECRKISVAPEVPIEPEVETRPEPEITTC